MNQSRQLTVCAFKFTEKFNYKEVVEKLHKVEIFLHTKYKYKSDKEKKAASKNIVMYKSQDESQ